MPGVDVTNTRNDLQVRAVAPDSYSGAVITDGVVHCSLFMAGLVFWELDDSVHGLRSLCLAEMCTDYRWHDKGRTYNNRLLYFLQKLDAERC